MSKLICFRIWSLSESQNTYFSLFLKNKAFKEQNNDLYCPNKACHPGKISNNTRNTFILFMMFLFLLPIVEEN